MATVHSSGVAKGGLVTGIIGTSLAGLLTLGKMGNGGSFFGGCNDAYNSRMNNILAEKDAEIAKLTAEKYADNVGIGVYSALAQSNKEQNAELVVTRERLARNEVEFECLKNSVNRISNQVAALDAEAVNVRVNAQKTEDAINCLANSSNQRFEAVYNAINCAKNEAAAGIALESERRKAGDENLFSYVNATFVPGKLVMPKSSICPEVMARYNTWVAPTATATDTQAVTGSINVGI